jgi:D-glycero-D-manno-heptose 1,7-bisphosphate phosphatase
VDGWYYCPHHPRAVADTLRAPCECRKPELGMVRRAQAAFDVDLTASFVIGDRAIDMGMAARAGARGVFVRTGAGVNQLAEHGGAIAGAARVTDNLMEAVSWILIESGHPR